MALPLHPQIKAECQRRELGFGPSEGLGGGLGGGLMGMGMGMGTGREPRPSQQFNTDAGNVMVL